MFMDEKKKAEKEDKLSPQVLHLLWLIWSLWGSSYSNYNSNLKIS